MMRTAITTMLLLAACDSDRDDVGSTSTGPGTSSTTEVGESSSSEESSSSSGDAPWEPQPYGPCEYDPGCHCEVSTCVEPCEVDADCPGSGSVCIENGCYIGCSSEAQCDALFPDPAPNGQVFNCAPANAMPAVEACQWVQDG